MSAVALTTFSGLAVSAFSEYDVVGVDEGQFFEGLAPLADALAMAGKVVIVAALDGTYERKPFAETAALVPLADTLCRLTSVCNACGADGAPFSVRTCPDRQTVLVGGADLYQASCRGCLSLHSAREQEQPRRVAL
jgi:thymidine kinase